MGQELKPQWIPSNGPKRGEVSGTTIYILEILRHEFVDHLLLRDLVGALQAASTN
jgi:hypothetical protein